MKNADIPLWDKGDDTDSFTKGGRSAFRSEMKISSTEKTKKLEDIYNKILGRKPTNKELSFYKYRKLEEERLVTDLLESPEFLENIEKVRDFPDIKKTLDKSKATVMKLKSQFKDGKSEFSELQILLKEKDALINELRAGEKPFVVNREELSNTQYKSFNQEEVIVNHGRKIISPVKIEFKKDGLINRLIELFPKK